MIVCFTKFYCRIFWNRFILFRIGLLAFMNKFLYFVRISLLFRVPHLQPIIGSVAKLKVSSVIACLFNMIISFKK